MPSADEGSLSRYSSGWKPKGETERPSGTTRKGKNKTYDEIKAKCLKEGVLFEDPDFPAVDSNIFFSKPLDREITWQRPTEICKKSGTTPHFFVGGVSRFDVKQGILGDCWLLAAVSCLSQHPSLLYRVVPETQSYTDGYAGIFRFNFWSYGTWKEIVIDDRLPTHNDQLAFMHSSEKNEFWSSLLEKAYAKLNSSYESLIGGLTIEATEDFTGGVTEMIDLKKPIPANLFQIMQKAYERESLMGCATATDPNVHEAVRPDGLVSGHAYSITAIKSVDLQKSGLKASLIRIRNPWGNEKEWNGAWGDKSPEWNAISEEQRKEIGLVSENDGEFWMAYDDFIKNFIRVEICNLGADSLSEECKASNKKRWEQTIYEGEWIKNVNAGGCLNFRATTFSTNPQYRFEVVHPDENDDEDKGTVLIALMQHQERKRKNRTKQLPLLSIGYTLFKLPDDKVGPLDTNWFKHNKSIADNPDGFINRKEVYGRHKLPVGHYVLIPSTFEQDMEREFLLRLYTEKPVPSKEMDEETGFKLSSGTKGDIGVDGKPISDKSNLPSVKPTAEEKQIEKDLKAEFKKIAGADLEIDAYELRQILNDIFMKEFTFDGFSADTCRSLVAMKDVDRSGKLGYEEFKKLKNDLRAWKTAFKSHDVDESGNFSSYELRQTFRDLDLTVSNQTFNAVVQRYSHKDGKIYFDDFIHCIARLTTMFEIYAGASKDGSMAKFTVDQFIQTTMYS